MAAEGTLDENKELLGDYPQREEYSQLEDVGSLVCCCFPVLLLMLHRKSLMLWSLRHYGRDGRGHYFCCL